MALDLDMGVGVGGQPVGIGLQYAVILRLDGRGIVVEMDVAQRSAVGTHGAVSIVLQRTAAGAVHALLAHAGATGRQVAAFTIVLLRGASADRERPDHDYGGERAGKPTHLNRPST